MPFGFLNGRGIPIRTGRYCYSEPPYWRAVIAAQLSAFSSCLTSGTLRGGCSTPTACSCRARFSTILVISEFEDTCGRGSPIELQKREETSGRTKHDHYISMAQRL